MVGCIKPTHTASTVNQPLESEMQNLLKAPQKGQGMTEYLVIVSIVAVAAIGVYSLLGQTLRNQTAGLAMEIAGQDAATAIGNAQTNANTAQTNANQRKSLDNYNLQNH
jgi:Flp pilus assembly pilin Flp